MSRIVLATIFVIAALGYLVGSGVSSEPLIAPKPRSAESTEQQLASKPLLFERAVQPLFKAKCVGCHNPKAHKAELDLTSYAGVMKGGESGKIIDLKKPEKSTLYEYIHEGAMPPEGKNPVSKPDQQRVLRWIRDGAKSNAGPITQQLTQHDVLPILYLRCTVCHGLRLKEGGLDLRTKAAMLKGGKSGPAIVPGHPEQSLLLKRIHAKEMPPRKKLVDFGVRPVEPPEIEKLTKWIAAGAPTVDIKPDVATAQPDPLVTVEDRQFWSFQTPKRPAVPKVRNRQLVRNEIDAFLLRKLESRGLSYSPPADRYTLIRRVAFDLTGLPPAWEDVQRFVNDKSSRAYERMVDRYLASPHYGERWGQYWLDVAGYSDSEGKRSADVVRPNAWRYRDYVIQAFNKDKPYDRFLLEQLAGDELVDYRSMKRLTSEAYDDLVATGFLRMAPDGTGSDIVNTVVERMEVIADEINVLGTGVLGLSVKCAQCHSHKYDPIPQRDYYRLVAIFQGALDVHDWLRGTTVNGQTRSLSGFRTLTLDNSPEYEAWKKDRDKRLEKINEELAKPKALRKKLVTEALSKKNRTQSQLTAAEKKSIDEQVRKATAAANQRARTLRRQMPPQPGIRALWDRGTPFPTYVFRRGDPTISGKLVGPGVLSVLTDGKTPFAPKPPYPGAKSTGRRLAFAKWLTDPKHPLTARVMVNRIWYHHFGRGIVKTLGNFGRTGTRPTHPELLDWLATQFIRRKWSIKQMHRLIMNSTAYRQSSRVTPRLEEADPANEFLSRMPLRRMEAEVVRDSVLATAGELDLTPFGKPDPIDARADGLITSKRGKHGWRRSVYVQHRRTQMPTILENFDLPQMIPNCIRRPTSTVSSQALHLRNNAMIRQLAQSFAQRVQQEVGDDPGQQIERVYQIALSRPPSKEERRVGVETLRELRAAWSTALSSEQKKKPSPTIVNKKSLENVCHTIVNSAAFLYVD